eukprot:14372587-Ditylum_brightwellii.AAC.1
MPEQKGFYEMCGSLGFADTFSTKEAGETLCGSEQSLLAYEAEFGSIEVKHDPCQSSNTIVSSYAMTKHRSSIDSVIVVPCREGAHTCGDGSNSSVHLKRLNSNRRRPSKTCSHESEDLLNTAGR